MTDKEVQRSVKVWIVEKTDNGHSLARAIRDILKNSGQNVRQLSRLIELKRLALDGVEDVEMERALEPFYTVVRREERILVNAKAVQKSG